MLNHLQSSLSDISFHKMLMAKIVHSSKKHKLLYLNLANECRPNITIPTSA